MSDFPALTQAPLDEVVCGIAFEPTAFDALDFGVYWEQRRADYPTKQLHPALLDGGGFSLHHGLSPARAWLVAGDETTLLQLQHDRFYMNWRARGGNYPRFRDHEGERGLKSLALDEFERFSAFMEQRGGARPSPTRVDLQKIDLLLRGRHWADLGDLARLLPIVKTFDRIRNGERVGLTLRLVEQTDSGPVTVQIASRTGADQRPDTIRIDAHTTCAVSAVDDVAEAFVAANEVLNRAFFGLIEPSELARFGVES